MVFVKTFFECIIHGINSGLAVFITIHGVDVLLLDEKENEK